MALVKIEPDMGDSVSPGGDFENKISPNESRMAYETNHLLGPFIKMFCYCFKKWTMVPPETPYFVHCCSANCGLLFRTGEAFKQLTAAENKAIVAMICGSGSQGVTITAERRGGGIPLPKVVKVVPFQENYGQQEESFHNQDIVQKEVTTHPPVNLNPPPDSLSDENRQQVLSLLPSTTQVIQIVPAVVSPTTNDRQEGILQPTEINLQREICDNATDMFEENRSNT